jgi:hypothetical protein
VRSFGFAAVTHSSGAPILTSVGVGGTGYIAGTIGGVVATSLAAPTLPIVLGIGATAIVIGALRTGCDFVSE